MKQKVYVMTCVSNKEGEKITVETHLYNRPDVAWENFLEHVMNNSQEDAESPDDYMNLITPTSAAHQWANTTALEGPSRGIEWFEDDGDGGWNLCTLEKVQLGH